MKLAAKCLIADFPHKCKYCSFVPSLKNDYQKRLLIPFCFKEYSYSSDEMFLFNEEIVGGDGNDVLSGKARVLFENGIDVSSMIKDGLQKIIRLMDSMEVYDIILPANNTLCGTTFIADGTFSGGYIRGDSIMTAYLKKYRS